MDCDDPPAATTCDTIPLRGAVPMKRLRLILGDQLNAHHSWFRHVDDETVYLLAELRQETDYVVHHVQKVLAFFAAMQGFARALRQAGHRVEHLTLDDTAAHEDLPALLCERIAHHGVSQFEYQQPDEFRLDQQLRLFSLNASVPVTCVDSEHFLTSREASQTLPMGRMEFFYRRLRVQYQVLLDEAGKPCGGHWNYDRENRLSLPPDKMLPAPMLFENDVREIMARLQRHGVKTLGRVNAAALIWPVSRQQSRELLAFFLHHCLPDFGRYQDALSQRGWSLMHSRLAFSLNSKMLHPLEVIQAAEACWREQPQRISLPQVEGFIRQILGWREYVRAVYWQRMPAYSSQNALAAHRPLPGFYWNGETRMACMRQAINQSLDYAYAHHIQRLMVTGNFALLAGIDPAPLDRWYLGIYIDAIEWVELPNTRGMSQFADGGLLASKPYAASGQYIQRMGDLCRGCHYRVQDKTGPRSCPFNSLYWHFIDRHQRVLAHNPRMSLVYANWARQGEEARRCVVERAEYCLQHLDHL